MMPSTLHRVAPWATALVLVALWWVGVKLFHVESYILPTPFEAVQALVAYRAALLHHGLATLSTTLIGFALAVAFGLCLGILVGTFRIAYSALYPILIAFNSVPKAALVPILVIWFGATIEPERLDVLRSLGASRFDMVAKIGFPRSLPYFFASLKIAITLAFVGSVIAEIVAGNAGIGNVMLVASSSFNVPLVFAALIVVGIMGVGMYAIFALFETRFASWSARGAGGIERMGGG
jgi:NitT/TauT family transport system permease protein